MKSQKLTLLPMSQAINLTPGTTFEGSITVANPADAETDLNYQVLVNPFSVEGEDYEVNLRDKSNSTMIVDWINISDTTGTVKPNKSKKIKFTVTVPKDAPAGGQYAALSVSSQIEADEITEGAVINNVVEMASIIYATVDGETVHSGEILENNIPSFFAAPPIMVNSKVKNTGNVHDYANYTLTITDVFTGRVILPNEDSEGRYSEIIMPDSTYISTRELSDLPLVGLIKVTQSIEFNGATSSEEATVLICPVWFIVLVALTLASFVAVIATIVRKHKRKKSIY